MIPELASGHGKHMHGEVVRAVLLPGNIRSSTMLHNTFKMCQFVLIIHLRDCHYDFDLE